MLLLVVLIVGLLAKDALVRYLGPAATVQRAGLKTQPDPAPGDGSVPAPANAMDRARGLQDALQTESARRGANQ